MFLINTLTLIIKIKKVYNISIIFGFSYEGTSNQRT